MFKWLMLAWVLGVVIATPASEIVADDLAERVCIAIRAVDPTAAASELLPADAEIQRLAEAQKRPSGAPPAWRFGEVLSHDLATLPREAHGQLTHELAECRRLLSSLGIDPNRERSSGRFSTLGDGEYLVAQIDGQQVIASCGIVASGDRRWATSIFLRGLVGPTLGHGRVTVIAVYYPTDPRTGQDSLFGGDLAVAVRTTLDSTGATYAGAALFAAVDAAISGSSARIVAHLRRLPAEDRFAPIIDQGLLAALANGCRAVEPGLAVAGVEARRLDQGFLAAAAESIAEAQGWDGAQPPVAADFAAIARLLETAGAALDRRAALGEIIALSFSEPARAATAAMADEAKVEFELGFAKDRDAARAGLALAASDRSLWRMREGRARARLALVDGAGFSVVCVREHGEWRIGDLVVHHFPGP